MKKKTKISIIIVSLLISIPIAIKFNLINVNFIFKFFSREGYLDETWDFEKTLKVDKSGYCQWAIGLKDNKIVAVQVLSGDTSMVVGNKDLKMNYQSSEDYYKRGGPGLSRNFIKEHN